MKKYTVTLKDKTLIHVDADSFYLKENSYLFEAVGKLVYSIVASNVIEITSAESVNESYQGHGMLYS